MVTCSLNGGSADDRRSDGGRNDNRNGNHHQEVVCGKSLSVTAGLQAAGTNGLHSTDAAQCSDDAMELCSQQGAIHAVRHLKMDHHDHPECVSITLYVKKINKESLQVNFETSKVIVLFRTTDAAFLSQHPTFDSSNDDVFQWTIDTRGSLLPEKCSHTLRPSNLELKAVKAVVGKWESVQAVNNQSNHSTSSSSFASKSSIAKGRGSGGVEAEKWISLAPKTLMKPSLETVAAAAKRASTPDDERDAGNRMELDHDNDEASIGAVGGPCSPSGSRSKCYQMSRIGYTGLGNLGNTCYMNAVLQSLANCSPLKNYFLGKQFQADINRDNPLGFGGSLAVSFAVILRQLWSGQRDSIEPSTLKSLLANRASQFSGYAQHDAQEFMAFLLDGLHEDLNRVRNKPLTSAVESDGRPDHVVAQEAWSVYKKRNDSAIVDLFQGQYRSTLVCPSCTKVSVTFDPFLYLALPLPASKSCFTVTLFFHPHGASASEATGNKMAVQVALWLDAANQRVEQLKDELKRLYGHRFFKGWADGQESSLEVVQVRAGTIRRWLVDAAPLTTMHDAAVAPDALLFAYESPPAFTESSSSPAAFRATPLVHIAVIQRALIPPLDDEKRCAACNKQSATRLKRCLKCYSVVYCNRVCQKSHWNGGHRAVCRYRPCIIGQPFIVSIPPSELTYGRLYAEMLHYSRFSVEVNPGMETATTAMAGASGGGGGSSSSSNSSLSSSSSSSLLEDEGAVSANGIVSADVAEEEELASQDQQQQPPLPPSSPPMFFIKPIDSQGQSIAGKERLEDRGSQLLDFEADESPVFLALDWRNDDRMVGYCVVEIKQRLDDCVQLDDNEEEDDNDDVKRGNKNGHGRGGSGGLTLHGCLEQFMQPEVLSREEAWYCPQCKEHREATKQLSLWRLPEILTIQLKRFSFRSLLWRDKIDHKVHFPIRDLDLSPYLSTRRAGGGGGGMEENQDAIYDLFAVVNHYGGILYGHYTAFARCQATTTEAGSSQDDEVGWRCMDDRLVRDVDSEECVVTPAAYLLLYRRRHRDFSGKKKKNDKDKKNNIQKEATTVGSQSLPPPPPPYSDPEEID